MAKADPSKLRDKAAAAAAKGKHKKALELYLKLEEIEPKDGAWARRSGEMLRQMDRDAEAIEAFGRALDRYAAQGFLVKAVAICKLILRMEPGHEAAQQRLVELNSERGLSVKPKAPAQAEAVAGEAPAVEPIESPDLETTPAPEEPELAPVPPPPIPVDIPLPEMSLELAVEGTTKRTENGEFSGVVEIPIDDLIDLELDEGIELEVDDEERSDEELVEALEETPLLSALPPESLRQLVSVVELLEFEPGQVVFHQGDTGDCLYVVVEGEVRVVAEGTPRTELTTLGEGEFFGEVALMAEQPRSATVEAVQASELLVLSRSAVQALIRDEPQVLRVLLRFLRERLVKDLIRTSPLFAPFVGMEREHLASRFGFLEAEKGAELVHEGVEAPALFLVMAGELVVEREAGGEPEELARLSAGDVFGEMSLLARDGAVASVRACKKCLLLELPAATFREVIMTHPQVLAFVGDLAAERERKLRAVASGEEQYEELHLDLF